MEYSSSGGAFVILFRGGIIKSFLSYLIKSPSALSLVAANLITTFFAIIQNWNILTVMLSYTAQTMIMGLFFTVKMTQMDGSSFEKGKLHGISKFLVSFYIPHIFYAALIVFLGSATTMEINMFAVSESVLIFLANHMISFFLNWRREIERTNTADIANILYFRTILIHATMSFGIITLKYGSFGVVFFMVLKMFFDLFMHILEHIKHTSLGKENP